MKGLLMMLKAFGLTDDQVEQMRVFIPQVPRVAQDVVNNVNRLIVSVNERLSAVEKRQSALHELQMEELRQIKREIVEAIYDGKRNGKLQRTGISAAESRGTAPGSSGSANGGNAINT